MIDNNINCVCHRMSSNRMASNHINCHKSNHRTNQTNYLILILFIFTTFTSGVNGVNRQTYLLFANRKDIRLLNADNQRSNASIIMSQLEEAAALDFYFADSIIFWTDIGLEMIKGIKINGSSRSEFNIIQSGIISPDGLACDWLTKKLYWTDSETNRIEVSRFDGSHRKVLFWRDLDQPRAIALVPNEGLMFWTDWGEVPKIERASMDGDSVTRSVVVNDNIFWPNGLTIDYEEKRLYWADAKLKFISSMDFSGSNRKVVVHGNLPHPFALTLLGDIIYWTDWSTRAIHSCNKNTGSRRKQLMSGQLSPMDIHVYSAARQLPSETPCDHNNGGCSHLCLLSSISPFYSCGCPTGVRLLQDSKTCATGAEELLLLARRVDIRRISLDTSDHTDVVLPLRGIKHAIAVDFDPVEGKIYWTDDDVHVIRRAFLNGSHQEDIIYTEVHHPDGIAIDWIARNFYWTDTGTDRIEVARLNGTSRKIILTEGLDEPRAIVVHPIEGLIFWTDWGSKPKIERAALDGSQRSVIISTSLGWPNGLAVDYDLSRIYWCDAKIDKIEMSNFDGSQRTEIVTDQLPHVFGFTLLNDWVYWSDWQRRSVERVHKITGGQRETIVDQLPDLMGLKAISVNKVRGTNPCAVNNGNCSHLCLYKPKRFVCACPMGYELATDLQTCIVPEAFLLFSRRLDIHRISLESHQLDLIPIAGIQEATAFDYDISDNRVYWTDVKLKMISRAFMNGSNIEHIIEFGLEYPEGIAVDWVAHNLYWADTEFNKIEVSRLDGTCRKILIWKDLDNPRSIALSPSEGLMFWSDWAAVERIERSALDGSQRTVIVNNAGRANSLTIDYIERRIYWVDIDSSKIASSDLDGSNRNVILEENLLKPYGLTVYQDYLYWADWETNTIERANKSNGFNRTLIQKQLDYVIDLVIYHNSRQSGWNPCAVNNGGCEHLCLALPSNTGNNQRAYAHNCVCSTHFILNEDNKTCLPPESFLLYSQRNMMTRLVMDSTSDAPDITLPVHNLKNVKAIAFDPYEQYIYWIDGRTLSIKKAHINGTGNSIVVPNPQDLNAPFDLELDPYSRVIYWTCSHTNSINVTRLDGKNIGAILSDDHDRPRSLALHLNKGYLFWVNGISPPKIERLTINGLIRKTVIENNLEDVSAIVVDNQVDLLFWADSALKTIESCNLNGDNRRAIYSSTALHPISLAVFGNYLYWMERDQKMIERVNKMSGTGKQTVYNRISHLCDIISVGKMNTNVSSLTCLNENGGCTHLCLIAHNESNRRCGCPKGLILSNDERTCINPPTCSPDEFACRTGKFNCIPLVWRCDGVSECADHSDEANCPQCLETQFRCPRSNADEPKCLDNTVLCDGVPDCLDGFDEQCCGLDEFKCKTGRNCLSMFHVCDGKADCVDEADESPKSCRDKRDKMEPLEQNQTQQNTSYSLVTIIAVAVVFFIVFITYRCRKKSGAFEEKEFVSNDLLMSVQRLPLTGQSSESRSNALIGGENAIVGRAPLNANFNLGQQFQQSSDPLYERNITGASSTSSSTNNYPKETLNPPPSPVTDQSQCNFEESSCSSAAHSRSSRGAILPSRHKKGWMKNRGPPPTPCSTDCYEDSEPSPVKYTFYDNSQAELSYDSDPYPPPPTPRSHYFSDFSGPPSPATERSFYNPYPPPPSPVPESDAPEIT